MKVLFVHPGPLLYSKIFLRLEPIGLTLVASVAAKAGHEVRLIDLQVFTPHEYFRELQKFMPDAVGFSLNYLANVPEVLDLVRETRRLIPAGFLFVGGHSASFISRDLLAHAGGTLDCVVRGEGEGIIARLLDSIPRVDGLPGVETASGSGPCPDLVADIDSLVPDRNLLSRKNRYFIGVLDPCASIEFSRGCSWDCSFCSAWTFYGRKYRTFSPEVIAEKLKRITEPNVFVADDVAFVNPGDGFAIGELVEKLGIRKRYYLETRVDVLIRNEKVFSYWKKLGMEYLFLGFEALDESGLRSFRKRTSSNKNLAALEICRKLGVNVAMNIIADPAWEPHQFEAVTKWALEVPEIVHLSIITPYPGTENWPGQSCRLATRDYRLFDLQHAVLPTRLDLLEFYRLYAGAQEVMNRKHLGFSVLRQAAFMTLGMLMKGRTNFFKMLWGYRKIYDPERRHADHFREARYLITPAPAERADAKGRGLFVHRAGTF
jgi:hopanoid C-3 methylase HpnR